MIFKLRSLYTIIFGWLCWLSVVQAEAADYYFKRFSIEHGLSHATVNTILRDHRGTLWVGTPLGLNQINRGSIKKYFYPSVEHPLSQTGAVIRLFEGRDHQLWAITNHGLYCYEPAKDDFSVRIERPIQSVCEVCGGVLFGGYSALYRWNYKSRELTRLPFLKKDLPTGDYLITFLRQINRNTILVGTESNGIYTYSLADFRLRPLIVKGEMVLNAIYWDSSRHELWLSLYDQGLFCYSQSGRLLHHYDTGNSALTNNIVLTILKHQGRLWVGTDGGGISVIDQRTGAFTNIRHIPGDGNSLPVNSIKTLYEDTYGNLWAGTVRDGLFEFKETYIRTYTDCALGKGNGLSDRVVNCIFRGADGKLWIGTDGGGINELNPVTGVFTHHLNTYNDKIVSITDLSAVDLLVSRYGHGLSVYHTQSRTYSPFPIVNASVNIEECRSGFVPTAYRISKNMLLILARNVYIYETDSHRFSRLRFAHGTKPRLSLQMMLAGGLTLLSKDNCLYRIDTLGNIRLLSALKDDLQITAVCRKQATDRLWIATSDGLYTGLMSHPQGIHKVAGNLFGRISAMQLDNRNRLWINSSNMLFSYDILNGRCMMWDDTDGFLPNDIFTHSITFRDSPYIYMGGINGLVKIDKSISGGKHDAMMIYLQAVDCNGKRYTAKTFPHEISQNFNSLHIHIAVNENDVFRHVLFRYRIRGEQQNSVTESYRSEFSIPSLTPGYYTVSVACMTKNGSWTPEKSLVVFRVLPPCYRRPWFLILAFLVLVGMGALAIGWTIRRNQQRMKWKMALHQQALHEDKIEFLTNVSHELRTPLTLIYAPLKRLLTGSDTLFSEPQRQQLEQVLRQAGYMKNIINWVLEYDKTTSQSSSLTLTFTDINHLLEEVVEDFAQEFAEKHILMEFDLDDTLRPLEMDRAKIRVVVSNLLMNALKFSREKSNVVLRTSLREDWLRVQVEDHGVGFGHLDREQLFTRFYRGRILKPGSGIGLAYCREIIEQHGGQIGAEDNPGGGAIMFFSLPYRQAVSAEVTDSQAENKGEVVCKTTPHILDLSAFSVLVVDDNSDFLSFLHTSLQAYFRRVFRARDGKEALCLLRQQQPDLVVSDVMMPIMDGYQLCQTIKEDIEISHIPVVLLTAKSDAESQKIGYKIGADAYIAKPFDIELLLSVIEMQLRRRELFRQKYQYNQLTLSPQQTTISNADEQFMCKLQAAVKEGYADASFDTAQVVDILAMSRASLYNKMKQLTGLGVNEFINNYRITIASSMLKETDKPIGDIAFETGFASSHYFSTAFKAATGYTPTAYRKQHHKDDDTLSTSEQEG